MASPPTTLKKRQDFLAMNRATRWVTPGFIVQYEPRGTERGRFGYTVSRKVGNAVVRNRVKRRLRALASDYLADEQADVVLIGRPGSDALAFKSLRSDLKWALKRVRQKAAQEADAP